MVGPATTWKMFLAYLDELAAKAKRIREETGAKIAEDFSVEELPAAARAMIEANPERKKEIMEQFATMRQNLAKTQPTETALDY